MTTLKNVVYEGVNKNGEPYYMLNVYLVNDEFDLREKIYSRFLDKKDRVCYSDLLENTIKVQPKNKK